MVNAKDLRLGNLLNFEMRRNNKGQVYDGLRGPFKIEQIKEDWVYARHMPDHMPFGFSIDQLEPIPLSPEILEVAGFDKCSCGGYKCRTLHVSKDDKGRIYYKGVDLIHLHQLQNLFYSLTGEELSIDLTKLKTVK